MSIPGTPRVLRAMNDRAALDLLLAHGPLSRTRVGELTGLSKPTASQLLARLEAAGLVVASGTSAGGPGPNARLYEVNGRAAYAAGLDVNQHRVLAAVADVTGTIVGEYELRTAASGPDAVRQVTEALGGAAKTAGIALGDVRHLVIATPGAFDPATGRLRYAAHLPGWHSPTLREELAAALPMPFAYENDVNLAAVAEQRVGAARGHEDFALLWNEEGIGAALVLGGRLHRGFTGGAGEVGFLPVPGTPLARRVTEANSGGYQELAGVQAVPALARAAGIVTADEPRGGSGGMRHGVDGGAAQVAAVEPCVAVAAGILAAAAERHADDARYAELLDRYAERVATGLASLVAVLDPELIVLAGDVLLAGGEPLRARVRAELADLAASTPELVLSAVPRRPVLRGALESALTRTRDEVFDTSRRT
ncbi:ROK family transcriptional regulator [Streptomyces sp. NPDC056144]|uniref:ROK family transcriptional regulator n=1 Tax=unclassified Streptomyces TaxID=2593676 RepID=UPI0035DF2604